MKSSNNAAYIPTRKCGKVVAGQLALIHVAKKELALSDEDYRAILGQYGVSSSKDLTMVGFEQVMAHLERLGFRNSRPGRQPARAPVRDADGPPFPAQLKMLDIYFGRLGFDSAERRQGFCQRQIKKPWPQTRAEANKVYEGLKAMVARNYSSK